MCQAGWTDADYSSKTACVSCIGLYGLEIYTPGAVGPCGLHMCATGSSDIDYNVLTRCVLCGPGTYVTKGSSGACTNFTCLNSTFDNDLNASTPCVADTDCVPGVSLEIISPSPVQNRVCMTSVTLQTVIYPMSYAQSASTSALQLNLTANIYTLINIFCDGDPAEAISLTEFYSYSVNASGGTRRDGPVDGSVGMDFILRSNETAAIAEIQRWIKFGAQNVTINGKSYTIVTRPADVSASTSSKSSSLIWIPIVTVIAVVIFAVVMFMLYRRRTGKVSSGIVVKEDILRQNIEFSNPLFTDDDKSNRHGIANNVHYDSCLPNGGKTIELPGYLTLQDLHLNNEYLDVACTKTDDECCNGFDDLPLNNEYMELAFTPPAGSAQYVAMGQLYMDVETPEDAQL